MDPSSDVTALQLTRALWLGTVSGDAFKFDGTSRFKVLFYKTEKIKNALGMRPLLNYRVC